MNFLTTENSKTSAQIVDELFKELETKSLDKKSHPTMENERLINDQKSCSNVGTMAEDFDVKSTQVSENNKTQDKSKRSSSKRSRKHRKRSRSQSSDDSSSDESRRSSKCHHHHRRKKKKKSDNEVRRRHKHKHSRKREKWVDDLNEVEWESDNGDGKNVRLTPVNVQESGKDIGNDTKMLEVRPEITENNNITVSETDIPGVNTLDESKITLDTDELQLKSMENATIIQTNNITGMNFEKEGNNVEINTVNESSVVQKELVDKSEKAEIKVKGKNSHTVSEENNDDESDEKKSPKKSKSSRRHRKKRKSSHRESPRKRSRSRSRSRSLTWSRSSSRSPSADRRRRRRSSSRSRRSRSRHNRSDWRANHHRHSTNTRSESTHRSNSTDRNRRRSRSPRRDVDKDSEKIDKAKLLEIARKNAMVMFSQGRMVMPGIRMDNSKQQQMAAFRAGGKSVAELTNFCKQLVNKDDPTSSEGESTNVASDEESGPFIQHPFKLKDPQPNIVMNIKNAVQVPLKTPAEKAAESAKLRIQFPVSSGSQHRKKESDWVPVTPPKDSTIPTPKQSVNSLVPAYPIEACEEKVFTEPSPQATRSIDIGNIVSQRLKAVKKLQENPNDVEALGVIYQAQQQAQTWAESKQLPGQFTGSTNARLLTPEELAGPAHLQAWVKKDQFNKAPPVDGGMGMYLLRKMGWNPGEGLGKHKEGTTEPLMLDIKMDKKGLTSSEETARKIPSVPALKDLSGKHPVSALVELCSKRKWGPPDFILVHDSGPDHKKNFLFQVRINNVDYQPTIASSNKKHAKAQAATVCLQALGLYPRDLNNPL